MQRISFKLVLSFLISFTALLITACSSVSTTDGSVESDVSPSVADTAKTDDQVDIGESDLEATQADAEEETPAKPAPDMDGDTLFNLLAAEFSGNAGDVSGSLN